MQKEKKVVQTIYETGSVDHCWPHFVRLRILAIVSLYIYPVLVHTKINSDKFTTIQNTKGKTNLDIPIHRLTKMVIYMC